MSLVVSLYIIYIIGNNKVLLTPVPGCTNVTENGISSCLHPFLENNYKMT